jgi:hypothetical protein
MQMEYYNLQLSKKEALEVLRALVLSAALDDEIRIQKGLEPAMYSDVLVRMLELLHLPDEFFNNFNQSAADDLWEYSWYAFTNEWAWFRAQQDAHKLFPKRDKKDEEYQKRAERLYKKHFEKYVAELNMQSGKVKGLRKRM